MFSFGLLLLKSAGYSRIGKPEFHSLKLFSIVMYAKAVVDLFAYFFTSYSVAIKWARHGEYVLFCDF